MRIQTKITFISSSIFGAVFLLASVFIYVIFSKYSDTIFIQELSLKAKLTATFYLEKDELNEQKFKAIERDFLVSMTPDQKVTLIDSLNKEAFFTESLHPLPISILKLIRQNKKHSFKIEDYYYYGLFYKDNQGDFIVLVSSQNKILDNQKTQLIYILLITFILAMALLIVLSMKLSKIAYKPVRKTIREVNKLDLNKDQLILSYPKTGDELEELFVAFNKLLGEIQESYTSQKNFVNHASHELKTPLSVIIAELELLLAKPRAESVYREVVEEVFKDALRLKEILHNLLLISGLNRESHQKKTERLDEILWEVIESLNKEYGEERFLVEINLPPEQLDKLEYRCNRTLLYIMFHNLLENAIKFSKEAVHIVIKTENEFLQIDILDKGIGISEEDLLKIRQPFYRGSNAIKENGSGLGFAVAYKIIELHKIDCFISSKQDEGTLIRLRF